MKIIYTILVAFLLSLHTQAAGITSGETLQITIKGVPQKEQGQVTGEYVVDRLGRLKLPYLKGYIKAKGSSTSTVARRIEAAYKSAEIYTTPTITIKSLRVDDVERKKLEKFINVTGKVKIPGAKLYRVGMTISEAVFSAAPDEFAALKRVELQRNGKVYKYNMKNPKHRTVKLFPKDIINVPQVRWDGS